MFERELRCAVELAEGAGRILMDIYARDFAVAYKSRHDPVTEADTLANAYIVEGLRAQFPEDGIVAEETPDPREAVSKERCWFVDPLDGTKEFIAKNGEFSVMIGLAIAGRSTLGVVYQPSLDKLYQGVVGGAASVTTAGRVSSLRVSDEAATGALRLVVSRSHRPEGFAKLMARLGATEERPSGSVGIKVGLIAEQTADLYVHMSDKSSLWDACGPEAILHAAGGRFTHVDGSAVDYRTVELGNRLGILACNAAAFAQVSTAVREVALETGFLKA